MTGADDLRTVAEEKARLRARAKRARARVQNREEAAGALIKQFTQSPWNVHIAGLVIAGYWPINSEIDCRPLLQHIKDAGARVALPAVECADAPLVFRLWDGCALRSQDRMNLAVPGTGADVVVPDIILVPLLLVDRLGHRLGYGGGYYDRTLKSLRQMGDVTALGLAFDAQLTDQLPAGAEDMTLDGVITSEGWLEFEES